MGKTNRAQRTKGNTRPSNSGHSAELLNSSGKTFTGFIGFDALSKGMPSYVPVTGQHTLEDTDSCVDATFRMIMRRMLKRDPTTRLKAIQEFGEHCSEEEKEVIIKALPFWPRLFNKLALDTDRRIREATHESNGKLLSKVKRDIAPYLKSIMGVWLLGQCDSYAPSASAAQSTFAETFPSPKQSEALMFCKAEVFSYFKDNLLEQTAKSMSEPNLTSEEDLENKYTLVISSTLHAVRLILSTLTQDERNAFKEDLVSILVENKFWKHSKSKNSQIRGAWFSLVGTLCRDLPIVFKDLEKKLSSSIFSSLSDTDPLVAPSIWEAALHTIVNFANCWNDIDVNKVVLPQLWVLLKEGGSGSASVLFPCLLPLLCKLPNEVTERERFIQQFFSTLRQSLYLDRIKISATECDAIIIAFMECLEFIVFHRLNFERDGSDLLEKIMNDQVLPLFESSFLEENSYLATSKLFPSLGSFFQKLEKKYFDEHNKDTEAYRKVLVSFWTRVMNIVQLEMYSNSLCDAELERKLRISKFITYFFHSMNEPSDFLLNKRKTKVRFEDDTREGEEQTSSTILQKLSLKKRNSTRKDSFLFQNTIQLCQALCYNIENAFESEHDYVADCAASLKYVQFFSEIVKVTGSCLFFEALAKSLDRSFEKESSAPLIFFKLTVLGWVKNRYNNAAIFGQLVDIVFAICSLVEKEEAMNILNSCCEIKNAAMMEELLKKSIKSSEDCNVLREWLSGPKVREAVTRMMEDATSFLLNPPTAFLTFNAASHHKILQYYLLSSNFSDSPEGANGLSQILLILKDSTEQCCDKNFFSKPALINFVCDATITILKHCKECWSNSTLQDLLVLLFHHSLILQSDLSDDTLKKTILTCQTAIQVSVDTNCQILNESGFISKAATEIHDLLISLTSPKELSRVLNHGFSLLSVIEEALNSTDTNQLPTFYILSMLLQRILPSDEDWAILKGTLHLNFLPAFFERKIFYPFPTDDSIPVTLEVVPQYIMVSEVVSDILIKEINRAKEEEDQKIIEEYITRHLPHLLWSFSYCEGNGHLNREGTSEYDRTEQLQKNCFKMLAFLTQKELLNLVNNLFQLSLSDGLQWALPFQTFIEIIKTIHPKYITNLSELLEQARESESPNKYITAQMLIHHVSTETKTILLKSLARDFVQMDDCWMESKIKYLGILAEVCCCLQDSNVLQSSEIQIHVTDLIFKITAPKDDYLKHCAEEHILVLQVMSILSAATKYFPCVLSSSLWNLIFDTLTSSLQNSRLSIHQQKSSDILLLHQASSLLYVISVQLADDNEQNAKSLDLPKSLWKSKIFDDVYQNFLFIFIFLAGLSEKKKSVPKTLETLLATVSEVTEFIPGELILNTCMAHVLLNNLIGNSGKDVPGGQRVNSVENVNSVLKMLLPYLTSSIHSIQFAAHSMLVKIIPLLPDLLKEETKPENDEDDDRIPIKLYSLIELLNTNNQIVESMLLDVKIGDCCSVVPYTDSYVYSMAYLLVWIEIFEFFSNSSSQNHAGYAAYLEESELLSSLFANVYRFMPEDPAQDFKDDSTDVSKKDSCRDVFINPPLLSSIDHPSSKKLQSVACHVYFTALRKVPSTVRTWWNNLDKQSAEIVNRFTSKYISNILISEEIQAVCDNGVQFNHMTVRARPFSREVVATYTVDDNAIELFVQLPRNYPLGPVTAEKRGRIEIAQQEWRHWLLQLTTILTIQNRSVLDGLTIWAKNLDKKFEGVEECTICYYILHAKSYKLPKLSCHICGKKFHAECLYKWFHTSNNSTCPLCRNEF